jgi:hypothetical protein
MPGGSEVIMPTTVFNTNRTRYGAVGKFSPVQLGQSNSNVEVVTHNYVKNYGMANGLPISDPASGFNPDDPWVNRDPRFYLDVIVDGDWLTHNALAGLDQTAQLYTGGRHRGGKSGSYSGYYWRRFNPEGCNQWDKLWDNFISTISPMRLADVYLMYAEAVFNAYGSAQSSAPNSITAEAAVNAVRGRAKLPPLTAAYTAPATFMDVIIRERAVELAFEAKRWPDLRRWNLNYDPKYLDKTEIIFDRDPKTGKPVNISEKVVTKRVMEKKNNWLPIKIQETVRYPEFKQNPGW